MVTTWTPLILLDVGVRWLQHEPPLYCWTWASDGYNMNPPYIAGRGRQMVTTWTPPYIAGRGRQMVTTWTPPYIAGRGRQMVTTWTPPYIAGRGRQMVTTWTPHNSAAPQTLDGAFPIHYVTYSLRRLHLYTFPARCQSVLCVINGFSAWRISVKSSGATFLHSAPISAPDTSSGGIEDDGGHPQADHPQLQKLLPAHPASS